MPGEGTARPQSGRTTAPPDSLSRGDCRRPRDSPPKPHCRASFRRLGSLGRRVDAASPYRDQRFERVVQRAERPLLCRRPWEDQEIPSRRDGLGMGAEQDPQTPFDEISLDRSAKLPPHDDPDPSTGTSRTGGQADQRQRSPRGAPPIRNDPTDVGASRHASQHAARVLGYTVSRFLPLARRRFKTRRPSLVSIRLRKPWVRLRRRLLGWRLVMDIPAPLLLLFRKKRPIIGNPRPSVKLGESAKRWPGRGGARQGCRPMAIAA